MRIVHIITGLGNGGAERTLYKLASQDPTNLHSIITLTTGGLYVDAFRDKGVVVDELGLDRSVLGFLVGFLKLQKHLRSSHPDLVQTWMYHANLIGGLTARMIGLPNVVWNMRASLPRLHHGSTVTWLIARILGILSWLVPRKIVYCAQQAREEHENVGYSASKSVVIQNGFNPAEWRPDPMARRNLRRDWGVKPSTRVFGMVARYHPKKNHLGLLEACARVAKTGVDFYVVLVGPDTGSENNSLLASIKRLELGEKVSTLGERKNVAEIMNSIDVLVLPSISGEGFPNVVAEAMLTGTPCVVSDTGDSRQIVGEDGWVFRAGSEEGLFEALQSALLESEGTLTARGRRARASVMERFLEKRMNEAYANLYASL